MSVKLDLTPNPTVTNSQHLVPISDATAEKLKYKMREALLAQKDQINEALRQGEAAREMQKVGNEMILSGQAKQAAGKQKLQEIDVKRQQVLTAKFYLIFDTSKKSDLTATKIKDLFASYLADGCIVIEKREAKSVMVIKSWEGVVKYLRDNPKVTSCDFSEFIIEANDTSKLTDLLTASNSLIGKVTCKGVITQDADTALKAAKLARRGSLEIELKQG